MLLRRNRMLMGLRCSRMERRGLLVLQSLHCGSGAILLFLQVSEAARPKGSSAVVIKFNELKKIRSVRPMAEGVKRMMYGIKKRRRTIRLEPISRMTQFVMRIIFIPNSRNR